MTSSLDLGTNVGLPLRQITAEFTLYKTSLYNAENSSNSLCIISFKFTKTK